MQQSLRTVRTVHLPESALAGIARQLGHPSGPVGRLVGRLLNRGNRGTVSAAAAALPVPPGATLADLGFGGGVGLDMLLRRLPAEGRVHGVEISSTMLSVARRQFRRPIAQGQLQLHHAPLQRLPLADASLDGAMTLNTLYFLSDADLPQALNELTRVLAPHGLAVVGVGEPSAMSRLPFTATFCLRPVADLIRALARAGLHLREHRRVGVGDDAYHLLLVAPAH